MFYLYDAKNVTAQQKEAALRYIASLKSKGAGFTRDEEHIFCEGFLAGYQAAEKAQRELQQKAAWASIDWRTVEPLDADEKCVDENRPI